MDLAIQNEPTHGPLQNEPTHGPLQKSLSSNEVKESPDPFDLGGIARIRSAVKIEFSGLLDFVRKLSVGKEDEFDMNFSSINSNVDIDVKSVMPKSEQQRAQNIARHNPENFQPSMREDFLTLSNYAVEFKDFNEMLEKEPEIREDEATKSKKQNKEDKEDREDKEDKEDREDKDRKKAKYKTYAIYGKKDLYNDDDSEGIIDQWG